jgi:hypothetical protein
MVVAGACTGCPHAFGVVRCGPTPSLVGALLDMHAPPMAALVSAAVSTMRDMSLFLGWFIACSLVCQL